MLKVNIPEQYSQYEYNKIYSESEVDIHKEYTKPKALLKLTATTIAGQQIKLPYMTKGNMSLIQGKGKSRKTFFITLLCYLLTLFKNCKIIVIDTEQDKYHSSKILKRLKELTDNYNVKLFSMRRYDAECILQFAFDIIESEKPDLLFIDNLGDLMLNINSQEETKILIKKIQQKVDISGVHCCFTMHENPYKENEKAAGAIGTELIKKCETIFKVELDGDKSIVKPLFCREQKFNTITFEIDEKGIPRLDEEVLKNNTNDYNL